MSPIGPAESFQRLEEFPSFVSCIKCFGRPIIPPLLTQSQKCELQQIRTAATNIEAKIFKRRKDLQEKERQKNSRMFSNSDVYSHFPSNAQESCALWYSSSKDYQDGISTAISKLPSSGIYSSVHTGAIVCSDVIENSHRYASRISRGSSYNPEIGATGCIECSHSNIKLDCHLCQAEYDQSSFHNCSFGSEVSPEVPCRSFSLQQNASHADDEHNSTMEETDGESLPTVICSQKYVVPDTDSESNVTCMTQSTDLDKYMELSCEFGSPDNSAATWDSKSTSQQFTLSRSDEASSETIVNTENELTPCASTLAEFTDNLEDELSNADEAANVSENKELTSGTLRRAHSIDSYMKIIQTCARSMHFKKSASEPFNTNSKLFSSLSDDVKTSSTSKTSHLIKEDSKESEDSKDLPEKDICVDVTSENISSFNDKDSFSNAEENSFQKKHVRRNSYTLDQPSSALILAHAECSCNLDAKCISPPHCSALKDQEDQRTNFAFVKEKVEVDIPMSVQEKYPVLNSDGLVEDVTVGCLTLPVVNIFPTVKEDSCKKSNLENSNSVEEIPNYENISTLQSSSDVKLDMKGKFEKSSDNLNLCDGDSSQEYFEKISQELQENHKKRAKELLEEQNRQWMKLQEEFKEKEKVLLEKLNQTVASQNPTSNHNPDFNEADHNPKEVSSDSISVYEEVEVSSTDVVIADSKQNCSFDSIFTENDKPENLELNSQLHNCSCLTCNSSEKYNEKVDSDHVLNVSSEYETPNNSPPKSINNIKNMLKSRGSRSSVTCSYESDINLCPCVSDSQQSMNGYSLQSAVLLPQCDSQSFSTSLGIKNMSCTCFYEESPKKCSYCAAVNGFKEYAVKISSPEYTYSENALPDHIEPHRPNLSSAFISGRNFNSYGVSSAYSSDYLPKTSDVPSKKANPTLMRSSKSVSSQDDLHFPNTVHSKSNKSSSQPSLKEKKLPVDNIISLCVKSLKIGSVPSLDVTTNKQIVIDPAILKRFEKLPAFVKGYLTRRLFKTERVQSLIKTLQDTALLIGKLSEDLSLKGDAVSERDVDFHRQLIVQLMTTFHNVYGIFCTISTKERMNIISESRNLKLKQKMQEKQEIVASVFSKAPAPEPSKKQKLSSATLKALERKRRSRSTIDSRTYTLEDLKAFRARSAIENRTYTINDLKGRPGRPRSHTLAKSHSVSPSSVYKVSIGLSPKRKTASCKTSKSHPCVHLKWVP